MVVSNETFTQEDIAVETSSKFRSRRFNNLAHRRSHVLALGVGLLVLLCFQFSDAQTASESLTATECLDCHDETMPTTISETPLGIAELLERSVHDGVECTDCHDEIVDEDHEGISAAVNCGNCHDEISDSFNSSQHGTSTGNPNAPSCTKCHGEHLIKSPSDSTACTSTANLPNTCSECHNNQTLNSDSEIRVVDRYDRYMRGIHGKELALGNDSAATCSDCHAVHDLRRASDPLSRVNKLNIPKTCSSCHEEVYSKYSRGIHGKALAAGVLDSPNCSDCHGEHEILNTDDPNSAVNSANLTDYICGKCHNNREMAHKYGIADERFTSYQDSYHGLALKGGSVKAASCVSCHNAHEILPQTNPASSIYIENRTATCRKCHPNANDTFAASYTHNLKEPKQQLANSIVRIIYIVLIVVVIASMIIHNLIILFRFIIEKRRRLKVAPSIPRFDKNMVFQHMTLSISFTVLAITGFALQYPDAWWVGILNFFGIFENTRSVIHRIAAIALIYISIHHVVFLFTSKRGKSELRAFLPTRGDLVSVGANLQYHLGLTKAKPQFDKYDYTEKAEYWAVVWGTLVMALTGLVLWFPTFFTTFLPAWAIKISETIHFYEAWLATLAIGVFHFFFVIFHPKQYPMSLTWLTGEMSVEEVEEHHKLWYEQLQSDKIAAESKDDTEQSQDKLANNNGATKQTTPGVISEMDTPDREP